TKVLRDHVAFRENSVAGSRNVEYAMSVQVLVGDDSADLFRFGNRHAFQDANPRDLELRLQLARRLFGGPVKIGESFGRGSRLVNKKTRRIGDAPGIGELFVEHSVAVVQTRGHGSDIGTIAQPGQPTAFGYEAHDALVRFCIGDVDIDVPDVMSGPKKRRECYDGAVL